MPVPNVTPVVFAFTRYFMRPSCPACGLEQFVPEHSAFVDDGSIRHDWLCDACGQDFSTTLEIGDLGR